MDNRSVPWTVSDAIIALVLFPIAIFGGTFVTTRILNQFLPAGGPIIALFIGYFILFLLIWYFAVVRRKAGWQALGFRSFNFFSGLGLVIAWFIIAKLIGGVYTIIIQRFGISPPEDTVRRIPEIFGKGTVGFILAVIVVVVVAPIVEELFFRGFIYPAFRQRIGVVGAIILSSFLFALAHASLFLIIPIMALGVALTYLYEATGSLGPPVMLHALNNLLSVILIYYGRILPIGS